MESQRHPRKHKSGHIRCADSWQLECRNCWNFVIEARPSHSQQQRKYKHQKEPGYESQTELQRRKLLRLIRTLRDLESLTLILLHRSTAHLLPRECRRAQHAEDTPEQIIQNTRETQIALTET